MNRYIDHNIKVVMTWLLLHAVLTVSHVGIYPVCGIYYTNLSHSNGGLRLKPDNPCTRPCEVSPDRTRDLWATGHQYYHYSRPATMSYMFGNFKVI